VSVVMAVYNEERFVCQAISSIVDQTFTDWEFIIINDNSKDATSEILSQYSKNPKIRIIAHKQNKGLASSLNEGIDASYGKFIARMDGDDVSLPQRLERQVEYLLRHPNCAVVGTGTIYIDEDGNKLFKMIPPNNDSVLKRILESRSPFTHGSLMFNKKILIERGSYDSRLRGCEDYELLLRLSEKHEIASIDEKLFCWRKTIRGESNLKRRDLKERTTLARRVFVAKRQLDTKLLTELYNLFDEHYKKTSVMSKPSNEILKYYYAKSLVLSCIKYGVKRDKMQRYLWFMEEKGGKLSFILKMFSYIPVQVRKFITIIFGNLTRNDKGIRAYE